MLQLIIIYGDEHEILLPKDEIEMMKLVSDHVH
jgi:hypothetical protein